MGEKSAESGERSDEEVLKILEELAQRPVKRDDSEQVVDPAVAAKNMLEETKKVEGTEKKRPKKK